MRVLIACEYSGQVVNAFRANGHEAFSVDVIPTERNPEWHIVDDVRNHLTNEWEMIIAFPPCTHLTRAGAADWHWKKTAGIMDAAIDLVKEIWNAPVHRVAIENPIGALSTYWMKPTQIFDPYQFGEPWRKRSCLWLRGLPPLTDTNLVKPIGYWIDHSGPSRGQKRAYTLTGVAKAMAEQWGVK